TTVPYYNAFRARLRGILGAAGDDGGQLQSVVRDLTVKHASTVRFLLAENDMTASDIDLIGFHGHTIWHSPDEGITRQVGDGELLSTLTEISVIDDFRSQDVAAGGQGAPLAPLFHAVLARNLEKPLAIVNLGGVANITWIGSATPDGGDERILAFDTGPGNAPIDDWIFRHTGKSFDEDGALARAGTADEAIIDAILDHPFYRQPPPKSLDRHAFDLAGLESLSPADGAATLTKLTAASVARARQFLPEVPRRWLVAGGGRHNASLMEALATALGAPVEAVEAVGWNGDALEAQAFAYLAVRSHYGLPLSLPETTGVAKPTTGGTFHKAPN
ncbi:MAG: anhydro-N-acetylmuramic acid kinase, partial [Rhodospirillaceae bacterium]|nr:anhydro-N-acetylmuramic acid kinase [Rhodospirillaceae bacterium]